MKQLTHLDYEKQNHNLSIIVVCDRLQSAANLGSIVRISEAFGVSKLFVHTEDADLLKKPRFTKTSRHSFKNLEIKNYETVYALLESLKSQDYLIVSLEKCNDSQPLKNINFSKKTCCIIGHENFGVNQEFLNHSDVSAHINMYGKNSSMNVSQATAIVLYECIRQLV